MINHVAIIPDGNRHWALEQNLPKTAGYPQAIKVIERCCYWAIEQNIPYISFYCFSTENYERRPQDEIDNFINLATQYINDGINYYLNMNIKIIFRGRKDRLPAHIIQAIEQAEKATENCNKLNLILCIDYGGKNEIIEAIAAGAKTEQDINLYMNQFCPDPEIIIRTSGVQRLSNFLLWQSTYSELFFIKKNFPDLNFQDLDKILKDYYNRYRNFGA